MTQMQPARSDPAPSLPADSSAGAIPPAAASPPGRATAGYQVVARRYRPQRFDELVGQEHVARGLSGAIESGRIGHAYLFTGARGVGKTSAARIYAKALECTSRDGAEPCNACEKCRAIAAGQDVDVVEVDAASNRGIDEIRQLRQNVAVRPARGSYKIYIIDEVHMLTREAFNALLKTLEEPPAHVKFVLCTTEPEKLPITILSRCQRFDFQTVDAAAIARRLEQIVAAEGAEVTAEALALIARRAAGSMRDSQSLLEQLLGSAAGPIGIDEVHAVIGTGREEVVGRLVAAVVARDPRAALECLDLALAGGADPGGVLEQVLAALRDALVASVGCGPETMQQGPGIGVDLAAVGRSTGTVTLLAMLQIVDQTLSRMRSSGHARVLAEMAVVRLAALEDLDDLAAAVERVAANSPAVPAATPARATGPTAAVPPAAVPPAAVPPAAVRSTTAGDAAREKKTTDVTAEPAQPVADRSAAAVAAATAPQATTTETAAGGASSPASSAASLAGDPPAGHLPDGHLPDGHLPDGHLPDGHLPDGHSPDGHSPDGHSPDGHSPVGTPAPAPAIAATEAWQRASESVGGLAADFAALATAVAWRDDVIEVVLPASATSSLTFLRRPEVAAGLSRAVSDIAGRPARLALVVEQPPAGAAARTAAPAERPRAATSQAALVRETAEHPLVSHARTVFDAAIRKVEPSRGPRAAAPVAVAAPPSGEGAGLAAAEDELDHSADDADGEPRFGGEGDG